MEYLVLQRFRSFGVLLQKGTVVNDKAIRSPYLRQSEGKIIPAVSSLKVPVEQDTEESTPQVPKGNSNKQIKMSALKLKV